MLRGCQTSVSGLLLKKHWNFLVFFILAAMPLRAADPRVGMWRLSDPSRAASLAPATYNPSGTDGVRFFHGSEHYTAQLDGNPYPATSPDFDMVSLRRVDPHTVSETRFKSGKQVEVALYRVSPDGRRMTVTRDGMDTRGKPFHSEEVWEKE
jgi:hypothetical protein